MNDLAALQWRQIASWGEKGKENIRKGTYAMKFFNLGGSSLRENTLSSCCWTRTDLTPPVLSFPRQIGIWLLLQRFYCGSHARIWEAVKGCNNISAWLSASAPLCDGAEKEPHILNSLIYGRMAYTSETHSCTHKFFLKNNIHFLSSVLCHCMCC